MQCKPIVLAVRSALGLPPVSICPFKPLPMGKTKALGLRVHGDWDGMKRAIRGSLGIQEECTIMVREGTS